MATLTLDLTLLTLLTLLTPLTPASEGDDEPNRIEPHESRVGHRQTGRLFVPDRFEQARCRAVARRVGAIRRVTRRGRECRRDRAKCIGFTAINRRVGRSDRCSTG